jgi:hypothetical protein
VIQEEDKEGGLGQVDILQGVVHWLERNSFQRDPLGLRALCRPLTLAGSLDRQKKSKMKRWKLD